MIASTAGHKVHSDSKAGCATYMGPQPFNPKKVQPTHSIKPVPRNIGGYR